MRKQILLVGLCLLTACAHTQPQPAPEKTETEPPRINSVDVVKALPQETTLAQGESGFVPVRLQIKNGYHVNANPPSQSYLKATEIELKPAEGISVEFISYPDPLIRTFAFSETPLKVYEGETELKVHLKADKSASPGKHNLSAKLRVQACDDKVCYSGAPDIRQGSPDPCPPREATDQRTAGGHKPESRLRAGRTLPTGRVIGRMRRKIFDFAVLSEIPI